MNSLFELAHVAKRTAPDAPLGDLAKEPFYHVEPRRPGRREVNVPMRAPGKPILDFRRLVGAVVVHDQMHVQPLRNTGLNRSKELQEFLMAVLPVAFPDDFARGDVQCGEQGGCSVADIVVTSAFGITRRHRQQRLRSVQGLNLRLLIDAQDHRFVRRGHIQAHDIAHLFNEERVLCWDA